MRVFFSCYRDEYETEDLEHIKTIDADALDIITLKHTIRIRPNGILVLNKSQETIHDIDLDLAMSETIGKRVHRKP